MMFILTVLQCFLIGVLLGLLVLHWLDLKAERAKTHELKTDVNHWRNEFIKADRERCDLREGDKALRSWGLAMIGDGVGVKSGIDARDAFETARLAAFTAAGLGLSHQNKE